MKYLRSVKKYNKLDKHKDEYIWKKLNTNFICQPFGSYEEKWSVHFNRKDTG